MVERLWAPWRLAYITGEKPDGCVLCAKQHGSSDAAAYMLARSRHSFVILNRHPYANGHMMIVPARHVADITDLTSDERQDLYELQMMAIEALRLTMAPDGINLGTNLGAAAGAGIAAHLHLHVVPRWSGDTNFMPVVADTLVMPQHLAASYEQLLDGFRQLASTGDPDRFDFTLAASDARACDGHATNDDSEALQA